MSCNRAARGGLHPDRRAGFQHVRRGYCRATAL